jgi:phosphatidylethanolamine-binding protein (PEBP) family uncharacterized protein
LSLQLSLSSPAPPSRRRSSLSVRTRHTHEVTALPADAGNPDAGLLPEGAITIANESREERFEGAAPPAGHGDHRYVFTVSALDVEHLELPAGCTPAVLGFVMRTAVIGRAQLVTLSSTPAED